MAEVELGIGGYRYRLSCEEGEQARITTLADMVDREATSVRAQAGGMSEARQLLYAALTLADRLDEAQTGNSSAAPEAAADKKFVTAEVEEVVTGLADRVELLADMLEKRVSDS